MDKMIPEMIISLSKAAENEKSEIVRSAWDNGIRTFEASPSLISCLDSHGHTEEVKSLLSSISLFDVHDGDEALRAVKERMQTCGVERFDCLYLDEICEGTIISEGRDLNEIFSTMRELVNSGRIGRLGFAFAGLEETLEDFLKAYGSDFSFCVVQTNYMDWFLKRSRGFVQMLREQGIEVIGRNISRDGKLIDVAPEYAAELTSTTRDMSSPLEWACRWLQAGPKADRVILEPESCEQLDEMLRIFAENEPLSANEEATAYYVAGRIRNIEESIYCSGCLFCYGRCPAGLDVRYLMQLLVDMDVEKTPSLVRQYQALPVEKRASACIRCGECYGFCQKIRDIPFNMYKLAQMAEENI